MAFVSDGFVATVTMVDTAGDSTIMSFPLISATLAAATTDLAAIIGSLGVLSDAIISAYSLAEKTINDALVYPVDAEIENEAFFSGKIVGRPNRSGNFRIPAPVDLMFTTPTGPGHNIVDMSYAPLVTFLGMYDGSGPISVSDGEQLVTSSVVGHRRHKGTSSG